VDGGGSCELVVGGTVGAPTLVASAVLENGRYGDLAHVGATLRVEGEARKAEMKGTLDLEGARALDLTVAAPLDLAELSRDPGRVTRDLLGASFTALAETKDLDLSKVAGRFGAPKDLAGRVDAHLELSGTPRVPRGDLKVTLRGGVTAGYAGLSGEVIVLARDGRTSLSVETAIEGATLARLKGQIALPLEKLRESAAREAAPLEARFEIPGVDLGRAGARVPVAGDLSGSASFEGSLTAPRFKADLAGKKLVLSGHVLGDLTAQAEGSGHSMGAKLHVAVEGGGTLDGSIEVEADASLPALRRRDIGTAPAKVSLVAKDVDLGFLPSVSAGLVRSAQGTLTANITATGPLARMLPRGEATVTGGKASVVELGDLTGIAAKLTLAEEVVRIDDLTAHRGEGSLDLKGELSGINRAGHPATLSAELRTSRLDIPRAGQTLATVDLDAKLAGKVTAQALDGELTVASAYVKLPDLNPRRVQSLAVRDDILVAPFSAPPVVVEAPKNPYRITLHVLVPSLVVKSDKPVIDLDLRVDTTATVAGAGPGLRGEIRVLKGRIEPVSDRSFDLGQGRIEFSGGGYESATLEIKAVYENTTERVTVTVTVTGTIEKPDVALTSQPALPESQIALLIATGHKELRADTGGVGVPDSQASAQSTQTGALGTLSSVFVKDVVGDKLPVDMVSIDPSQLRAGKYVSDKLYVGYTRRMNALTEEGENTNEVEADYQIGSQLTFQVRYGDANSGGASLIWSKDY
jgi:translocation and assembly module TamB